VVQIGTVRTLLNQRNSFRPQGNILEQFRVK
jgi:hypothetical protein